jgi:hypothetical protein
MSALHLLWIIPLAASVGFFAACLCFMASDGR